MNPDQRNVLAKPRLEYHLSTFHALFEELCLLLRNIILPHFLPAWLLPPLSFSPQCSFRCICFFLDLPGSDVCSWGYSQPELANLKRCPERFLCQNLYFWPRTIPLKWRNQRLLAVGSCVLLCSRCLPLLVMSRGPCTRHSELGTRVVWAEVGRPVPEQEPLETVQWSEPQTQEEQHSPTWLHCLGWTLSLASSLLGVGFVYSSPHPCHTHII